MQWILGVCMVSALSGTTLAQINYVQQSRSVFANTNAGSQSFSSSDGGYWSQGASSYNPFGPASAGASQTSDLRRDAIVFDASTSASNQNGFLASCSSSISVQFLISQDTPFELVRTAASFQSGVRLLREGTTVFYIGIEFIPSSYGGVLAPGSYTMSVNQSSQGVTGAPDWVNDTSAHFILYVPTPGGSVSLVVGLSMTLARRRR